MTVFDRFKNTNFLVPALCVALILFMTAQLVVITILGVSFKGVKQFSSSEKSSNKSTKRSDSARSTAHASRQVSVAAASTEKNSALQKKNKKSCPLLHNPTSWPPVENRLYPDMELYNQDGKLTRLSDFSGNVIIVQPVAMSCPLTQAYSGANKSGKTPFRTCFPNNGIVDFPQKMNDYAGISMNTPGLVFVQIIFYNMENQPPTIDDAKLWAKHFDLRTSNNQYVLVANPEMVTRKSAMLIPGFQLIDRSFILRSDSTGVLPKRNLYLHFFPTLQDVFRVPRVSTDRIRTTQDSEN